MKNCKIDISRFYAFGLAGKQRVLAQYIIEKCIENDVSTVVLSLEETEKLFQLASDEELSEIAFGLNQMPGIKWNVTSGNNDIVSGSFTAFTSVYKSCMECKLFTFVVSQSAIDFCKGEFPF